MEFVNEALKQPQTHSYDSEQRKLTVRGAEYFPEEIFQFADDVEILDMSHGHMMTLPDKLEQFQNMRVAFFSYHDFQEVPGVLSACRNLEMVGFRGCRINRLPEHVFPENIRAVILTDNLLETLPDSIGEYSRLQKLQLSGNPIEELPRGLLECENLEQIRVSAANLAASPDWLMHLPSLAWYVDAGNPFRILENSTPPRAWSVSWDDLHVAEQIGESANNKVFRAEFNGQDVAIKLFGAELSTDGLAADDMSACLLAGTHQSVIGGIGEVVNVPDGRRGLIMPLVPEGFKKLGLPPDFQTLTRDVFLQGTEFELSYVSWILQDVASALCHLHSRGIMHGDIYAHNILTNMSGRSYLGDFGAASIYKPGSKAGQLREKVDIKGFGYLVDDLLSLIKTHTIGESASVVRLERLREACLAQDVLSRPSFSDIVHELHT